MNPSQPKAGKAFDPRDRSPLLTKLKWDILLQFLVLFFFSVGLQTCDLSGFAGLFFFLQGPNDADESQLRLRLRLYAIVV